MLLVFSEAASATPTKDMVRFCWLMEEEDVTVVPPPLLIPLPPDTTAAMKAPTPKGRERRGGDGRHKVLNGSSNEGISWKRRLLLKDSTERGKRL